VIALWTRRERAAGLGVHAVNAGMPRWVSVLGGFEWVARQYGPDVASFARHGRRTTTSDANQLDGLWCLLNDYAAPLTRLTAMIAKQAVRETRAGLTGDNRKRLDDKLRDTLCSVVCSALAESVDSRAYTDLLLREPDFPPGVVAIAMRRAIDVAEAFAATLQEPGDAADRRRILARTAELAVRFGRNPPPPKPPEGARKRAWELIEPEYLALGGLEWVPTFEGRVYMVDVLGVATESVLKQLVNMQAEGIEVTHAGVLSTRVKQRAIDWVRARRTQAEAETAYSGAGTVGAGTVAILTSDLGGENAVLAHTIAVLERNPEPHAPLARRLLHDRSELLRGDRAALVAWVAQLQPEYPRLFGRDPGAVAERAKVLIFEAVSRGATDEDKDVQGNGG
jgi:hypothetical protein